MRRQLLNSIAVIVLLALVAACGSGSASSTTTTAPQGTTSTAAASTTSTEADDGWADVEEAANAEGRLTIYGAQGEPVLQALAAHFMEDYPGIQVDVLRLTSGQLSARYTAEAQSGVFDADIVVISVTDLFDDFPEWWEEITPDLAPNVANWPEENVFTNHISSTMGEQGLVYNTDLLSEDEAPKSWEDVLKEEFRGKGAMSNPTSSPTHMNPMWVFLETYGEDFLRQLSQQNFTIVESGVPGSQQVAAGGALFAFPVTNAHAGELIGQGAPLKVIFPSDNSPTPPFGSVHLFSVPKNRPHPNAARVFFNWYLTPEAQRGNCEIQYYSSPLWPNHDACPEPKSGFRNAGARVPEEVQAKILELLGME